MFQAQLTEYEYADIFSFTDEEDSLIRFYTYWALKESYIKAIGIGLAFELQNIEFYIDYDEATKSGTATSKIYGEKDRNWR